jgi:RNA polymerase sigma factor (sigma-70 family)
MTAKSILGIIDDWLGEAPEQSDGQLLERFLGGDRMALESLVRRHAAMVWGVCLRTLGRSHDADDAFQATFLVLLRKAGSIGPPERLAKWLYGVAYKTACKARQTNVKLPQTGTDMPEPKIEPPDETHRSRLRALDEELSRLPQKYRTAIVQCELEERSLRDVAQQLGVPQGTVASRLARGRAILAQRLTQRGLGVSATSVGALWSEQAASGAAPSALLNRTIEVIRLLAAGKTATAGLLGTKVSTLANGVLRAMAWAKWKAAGAVLLLAGLAMGGGVVTYNIVARPPRSPESLLEATKVSRPAQQADEPVIVVSASYPGANAQVVADTVAAPIEQLINEAEERVRIESTSDNEGNYTSYVYFKPKTDLKWAVKIVETAVWRAEPVLPDVLPNKVSVKIGKAEALPIKVDLALLDFGDQGWVESRKVANDVVKRLAAEDALMNPQVLPKEEMHLDAGVDGTKCESLGVPRAEVFKVLQAGWIKKLEAKDLRRAVVRDKITLGDVAVFKESLGPAAVYRIDLSPAIRITGTPPEGKSVASSAAECVELAEVEMKRLGIRGFAVKDLSGKRSPPGVFTK